MATQTTIAVLLIIVSLTLLVKPLATKLWNYVNQLNNREKFLTKCGLVTLAFGITLLIGAVQLDWNRSALGFTLLIIGITSTIEAIILIKFQTLYWNVCNAIMCRYYLWMIPLSIIVFILGIFVLFRGYIGEIAEAYPCEQSIQQADEHNIAIYCNVDNPEDLVATPDNRYILLSEFGSITPIHEMSAGNISLFNLQTKRFNHIEISYADNSWGDSNCSAHPDKVFGPHGIDLVTREDKRYQFAIINHFPRESVELFELVPKAQTWQLIWRGCTLPPENHFLNDIALDNNGEFYVTHMYGFNFGITDFLLQSVLKQNTGYVLKWSPESGYTKVPNTEGAMPNGISINTQTKTLYIVHNLGDSITALNLANAEISAKLAINSPDNLVVDGDSLWTISLDHEVLDGLTCSPEASTCPLPFSIYQLDSNDLLTLHEYIIILCYNTSHETSRFKNP